MTYQKQCSCGKMVVMNDNNYRGIQDGGNGLSYVLFDCTCGNTLCSKMGVNEVADYGKELTDK